MKLITFARQGVEPCVILGAGVAGHAAAVWLDSYRVPFRWISAGGQIGGMLERVYNKLVNVPGHTVAHGPALIEDLLAQIEAARFGPPEDMTIERIEDLGPHLALHVEGEAEPLLARVVIVATGTRYKTLAIPGIERTDRVTHQDSAIVSYSASQDAERFRGEEVAVIGGGDAAFEGAMILAQHDCRVHLLLRSRPKARRAFVGAAREDERITTWPIPTTVSRVEPVEGGERVRLELDRGDEPAELEVSGLFLRVGVEPVCPAIAPEPERDEDGHLIVDADQRTSVPRLLAAGDITAHPLRSIVSAAAGGARAALATAHELGAFGVTADEV